jgi:hypothetical protein
VLQSLKRRVTERLERWEARFHEPVDFALDRRRPAAGPPVFILAAPLSGADRVSSALARHPRFACARETLFMVGLLATLREKNCVTGYSTIGVTREAALANIRVLARNYYERFLYVSDRPRWADSTASHAPFMSELQEVFAPDVRFVHVVRHGIDAAYAMANAGPVSNGWGHWVDYFHQDEEPEPDFADRLRAGANLWQGYNRMVRELAERRPDVCHVIRIEDLDADPEAAMRRLLEFVGEGWMPDVLEGLRQRSADVRHPPAGGATRNDRGIHEQLAADLGHYGYGVTCR